MDDFQGESIINFYNEVNEVNEYVSLGNRSINTSRNLLNQKMKEVQQYRCLSSIQTGYYTRVTQANAEQTSQLPFLPFEGDPFSSVLPCSIEISRFLTAIYQTFNHLPDVFINLLSAHFVRSKGDQEDLFPFLPPDLNPRVIFAFSTLPSLFGHCWTRELKLSYIQFLVKISSQLKESIFEPAAFSQHWISECIKAYALNSNIHSFLRQTISDDILQLTRNTKAVELSRANDQVSLYRLLVECAIQMIKKMRDNLESFPKDVRYLFQLEALLASDRQSRLIRLESLFVNCVLSTAISNPKAYSLLPDSFHFDTSMPSDSNVLLHLTKVFQYSLHPQTAQLRCPEAVVDLLKDVPFSSFLEELGGFSYTTSLSDAEKKSESKSSMSFFSKTVQPSFKNPDFSFSQNVLPEETEEFTKEDFSNINQDPQLMSLLPLLGEKTLTMIFTNLDICLLSSLFQKIGINDEIFSKSVIPAAKRIPIGPNSAYHFILFDLTDFGSFGLPKPDITPLVPAQPPLSNISIAASTFYQYLSHEAPPLDCPPTFNAFLQYSLNKSHQLTDRKALHSLTRLEIALSRLTKQDDILSALRDEIDRQRDFGSSEFKYSEKISFMIEELSNACSIYKTRIDDLKPSLYSAFLQRFILNFDQFEQLFKGPSNSNTNLTLNGKSSTLFNQIMEKKDEFMINKDSFKQYFEHIQSVLAKAMEYMDKSKCFVNKTTLKAMGMHLHTWIMQYLPFSDYIKFHPNDFASSDQKIVNVSPSDIEDSCSKQAGKMGWIFKQPELFLSMIDNLHNAVNMEIPIESMKCVERAMNCLETIFKLTVGGLMQADDMAPLLTYGLLKAHIHNLRTFQEYISHFLYSLPQDIVGTPDKVQLALTHFVNHVGSLDAILEHR